MTQPSLNSTFDTSLIDLSPKSDEAEQQSQQQTKPSQQSLTLQESFSTTDTETSDQGTPLGLGIAKASADIPAPSSSRHGPAPPGSSANQQVKYVPTTSAYDAWASVYDTDGNVLQAVDDQELATLLPDFLSQVLSLANNSQGGGDLKIIDFGCGTGRNTLKLLAHPWRSSSSQSPLCIRIVGIDASPNMLALARTKWAEALRSARGSSENSSSIRPEFEAEFLIHNFLSDAPAPAAAAGADAVLSTLVLEHFPLQAFFGALRDMLRVGGLALVTNMHEEMGRVGQAGFVTAEGVKVRGESWAHGVEETVEEAKRCGFEIVGQVKERKIEESMLGDLGKRARKWVGFHVWYSVVVKRVK